MTLAVMRTVRLAVLGHTQLRHCLAKGYTVQVQGKGRRQLGGRRNSALLSRGVLAVKGARLLQHERVGADA